MQSEPKLKFSTNPNAIQFAKAYGLKLKTKDHQYIILQINKKSKIRIDEQCNTRITTTSRSRWQMNIISKTIDCLLDMGVLYFGDAVFGEEYEDKLDMDNIIMETREVDNA